MTPTRAYLRAARYFRDDWPLLIFSTALVALTTLASLAQPFPLAILIDSVLGKKAPDHWPHKLFFRFAPSNPVAQILLLAGLTLFFRLIQELLTLWQGLYKLRIGFNGLLRVRCDLYRKFQQLSLSYHRSRPQGDAIYRLSTDTSGFQAAFNTLQGIFVNVVTLLFMTWIMLGMSWRLALIALTIMPVLFWAMKAYGKVLMSTAARVSQIESELTTTIHRSVASISLVQAFGREDDEFARFHSDVGRSNVAWTKMHWQGMIYWLIIGMTFGLGGALIFGYGGYLVYKGALTVGFLWIFMQYVLTQLYDPLQKLSASGADMRRGTAGMARVYEVLDIEPAIRDAPDAIHLPRQPRVLRLDDVGFGYRPGTPVLEGINCTIRPGEMVAFVGASGGGKSTLLNLLPRFYDPTAGALRLDEHDARKVKIKDLRKHIALVLQENAILPDTVFDNIAYGRPEASREQIKAAAMLAGADAFIESLPEKYDTILHESGQNLSGGQRQRISIARALASEAPILVLDEPTSALDPHNEQMITETLRALKRQRTIVIVSHRLSTVSDCDRIYVMEGGRITEQGTHQELVALGGHYYEMARHQLKLGEPAEADAASVN